MDKIRALMEAGAPAPDAIRIALGMPVGEFAEHHGLKREKLSSVINGSMKPSQRDLDALIAHFGGTEDEWRLLLWEAGRPVALSA